MAFDPTTIRNGERVYLTQDAWDALGLVKARSEERDKFIEDAVWEAMAKHPGVIDVINARKELLRQFKEKQRELNATQAEH